MKKVLFNLTSSDGCGSCGKNEHLYLACPLRQYNPPTLQFSLEKPGPYQNETTLPNSLSPPVCETVKGNNGKGRATPTNQETAIPSPSCKNSTSQSSPSDSSQATQKTFMGSSECSKDESQSCTNELAKLAATILKNSILPNKALSKENHPLPSTIFAQSNQPAPTTSQMEQIILGHPIALNHNSQICKLLSISWKKNGSCRYPRLSLNHPKDGKQTSQMSTTQLKIHITNHTN
ncbi:hypothetical protein V2J09_016262 [Rumex salicifolius]